MTFVDFCCVKKVNRSFIIAVEARRTDHSFRGAAENNQLYTVQEYINCDASCSLRKSYERAALWLERLFNVRRSRMANDLAFE